VLGRLTDKLKTAASALRGRSLRDAKVIPRLLYQAGALPDDEMFQFFLHNPGLLSKGRLWAVASQRPELEAEGSSTRRPLGCCDLLRNHFVTHPDEYPIGPGPIEALLRQHLEGEMSIDAAISAASTPEVAWHLSPVYVGGLSRANERAAQLGNWRDAVKQHKLLLAAVDGMRHIDGPDHYVVRVDSFLAWIDIVTRAITEVPDGRLYSDALRRGKELATEAADNNDSPSRAHALHRLGILNLDPYNGSGPPQELLIQWRLRAANEFGNQLDADANKSLFECVPRLSEGAEFLREAASLREGRARARSLKALAQALGRISYFGGEKSNSRIFELTEECLSLFDEKLDAQEISNLVSTRKRIESLEGANLSAATSDADLSNSDHSTSIEMVRSVADKILSSEHSFDSRGLDRANTTIWLLRSAHDMAPLDLVTALRACKAAAVLSRNDSEKERAYVYRQTTDCLEHAFSQYSFLEGALSTADVVARIDDLSTRQQWPHAKIAAAIVAAAVLAGFSDREDLGLQLLEQAKERNPEFCSEYLGSFASLSASLMVGVAVNAWNSGRCGTAATMYLSAVDVYLTLNFPTHVISMLCRVLDLVPRLANEEINATLASFVNAALNAELIGPAAVSLVQQVLRQLAARFHAAGSGSVNSLILLTQMAKGMCFGQQLQAEGGIDIYQREEIQQALRRIDTLKTQLGSELSFKRPVVKEEQLCSYLQNVEPTSGANPSEKLRNLMHFVDRKVATTLLFSMTPTVESILSPVDIQQVLTSRDVLISYYFAVGRSGKVALYCMLFTSESAHIVVNDEIAEPDGSWSPPGSHDIQMDYAGMLVALTRRCILQYPDSDLLTPVSSTQVLTTLADVCFPPDIRRLLEEQHKLGRDHLCIVPHRALHFCPIHLAILNMDRLIVDDWNVTYVPNLAVLMRSTDSKAAPTSEMASFGVSFSSSTYGWEVAIPEACDEAREIASLFGTKAWLDDEVTKREIAFALSSSRRVHIASHGRQNVEAPCFQTIELASATGDNSIYAYELLDMDLRSLDIITLSACETALGRVDFSDNLRGLPGSLFRSGARMIVGTLWPVETNASRVFFVAFYSELSKGADKLSSFRHAQELTRERYPDPRDWGAFYMSGAWDMRKSAS
jgi:hypothetical protein